MRTLPLFWIRLFFPLWSAQWKKGVGVLIALALSVGLPARGWAAKFDVAAGDVAGLINAITRANATAVADTINIKGVYILTAVHNNTDGPNGLPSIITEITINSDKGATVQRSSASGTPQFRILHVGAAGDLTLKRVTIAGGSLSLGLDEEENERGAGIRNNGGQVTILNSTIVHNTVEVGSGAGIFSGPGALIVDNSLITENRVINIPSGGGGGGIASGGTLEMSNSIVSRNSAFGGGGIACSGTTTITGSTISGNNASIGGGLSVGGLGSSTTISNSTIRNNVAEIGGGILGNSDVTLLNSTVARNSAMSGGGGIDWRSGALTLLNSTITENRESGGISTAQAQEEPTILLQNTILALNVAGFAADTPQDCDGPFAFESLGNNVIGTTTNCMITLQATDKTGDPGLGPFTDPDAPGKGHFPLLAASQAIDAGNNTLCTTTPELATDQLGQGRAGVCDIGAVEFIPVVNDFVTFVPLRSTTKTVTDTTGCPAGFVGKSIFSAQLTNKPTSPALTNVATRVRTLTNGNLLLDRQTDILLGGVGAVMPMPEVGQYADGVLSPNKSVRVRFAVCLKTRDSFQFFVDVLGVEQ